MHNVSKQLSINWILFFWTLNYILIMQRHSLYNICRKVLKYDKLLNDYWKFGFGIIVNKFSGFVVFLVLMSTKKVVYICFTINQKNVN